MPLERRPVCWSGVFGVRAKRGERYGRRLGGSEARTPERAARPGSSRGGFRSFRSGGFRFFPLQIAEAAALFDNSVVRLSHGNQRVRGDKLGVKVGPARCQKIIGTS